METCRERDGNIQSGIRDSGFVQPNSDRISTGKSKLFSEKAFIGGHRHVQTIRQMGRETYTGRVT